jgi:hypothetical protein
MFPMESSFTVNFVNGASAQAIVVKTEAELSLALAMMGLQEKRPVLVVVGGASLIAEADFIKLQNLFTEVLAPLAQELGCYVVDGGTDAGVMKLIGSARGSLDANQSLFPLIGVSPIGLVNLSEQSGINSEINGGVNLGSNTDTTELEPHHSHFFLVPGNQWGDESRWLARVASLLAGNCCSVTVLINGGAIALVDVKESAKEHRPIVTIMGSGRLADEIAAAVLNPDWERRPEIELLLEQGQIHLLDLKEATLSLSKVLRQKLLGAE